MDPWTFAWIHCPHFLGFLTVFPFFSRDFRGSVRIKNPCFFGGFPCLFPKKQGKEGQGGGGEYFGCGGGGKCRFYFYGRGDFSEII